MRYMLLIYLDEQAGMTEEERDACYQESVTDGPFAETREQLGGYFLIDAANLDEAVAVAERIPGARSGTVEIRPVVELSGLP
jgi:hypothetical protein